MSEDIFITPLNSRKLESETLQYQPLNSQQYANLCGTLHENIKLIERFYDVSIKIGHDEATLCGRSHTNLLKAKQTMKQLHQHAHKPISAETVRLFLEDNRDSQTMKSQAIYLSRKTIVPRNAKQIDYLNSINQHDITFAIGPAGTGKTYLAVSKAIEAFEKGEVQRLVFVRPAVEAGEKLGFLPGDLVEKVLPYLRPIYDALYEMIGFKETQKLIQTDIIEVLPLAFMRGRTLNEAFIILDEAQNTTIPQMKMFLTRMGFKSKTVITGDITQIDLPKGIQSGLPHATSLLAAIPGIGIHYFSSREVVRHPLVSCIVDCYDANNRETPK